MHDATRNTLPACDGIIDSGDCDAGLHTLVDRVADDAIRIRVFDRTDVEFPLTGWMLGDIGEPDLVHPLRREIASYEIIMYGWAGRLACHCRVVFLPNTLHH